MDTGSAVVWFGLSTGNSFLRTLRALGRAGYLWEPPVRLRYECVILETQDGRLAKAGCRLSIRQIAQSRVWHFEGPDGEHVESFDGGLSFRSLSPDAGGMPPAARELAAGRLLFPLVRLKVVAQDTGVQCPSGSRLALRAERSLAAPSGDGWPNGPWPLGLLTIRFLDGNPDSLLHLATYARDRLGLQPGSGDLCRTALQALGLPEPGAPIPMHLRVRRGDPLALAGRKVIGHQVLKMKANIRGTLEGLDPEYLHDLRVANRRLRSALRLFATALGPKRSESLRMELRWIAELLGNVRDLDVFIQRLREQTQRLGEANHIAETLAEELERRRKLERDVLETALSSLRFRNLLHRLEVLAASPPPRTARGLPGALVADAAPAFLQKAQKRVLRSGRSIGPDSPTADLHRLRILFKRLRYACEFFHEAFADPDAGTDPLADYIQAMVRFQDCLGEHQDAVVAIGRIHELAKDMIQREALSSDQLLNVGALIQVQREIVAERRERLVKLWRKFDKGAVRKRLAALQPAAPAASDSGHAPAATGPHEAR